MKQKLSAQSPLEAPLSAVLPSGSRRTVSMQRVECSQLPRADSSSGKASDLRIGVGRFLCEIPKHRLRDSCGP